MAMFTAIGTALGATGIAATATGVGVTAAVAGAGYAAASMMSQGDKDSGYDFQMPSTPKAPEKKDAAAIAQKKQSKLRAAAARNTTVMTNPLGVEEEAKEVRKKLLGR